MKEVNFNEFLFFFGNFCPEITENYRRKKQTYKKAVLTMLHMLVKKNPAKFGFPTLVGSGRVSDFRGNEKCT